LSNGSFEVWKERREAVCTRRREGGQEKIRGTDATKSSMTGTRAQNAGERYVGAVTQRGKAIMEHQKVAKKGYNAVKPGNCHVLLWH
jgi:hypothetical protein